MPRVSSALLLIRIASAVAFLYHGSAILFGTFGGPGPTRFAGILHAPAVIGYLVGIGEFFGGLGILFGVLTRISAVFIAIIMLGAIFFVHLRHGFDIGHGGFEYALVQLLIALALVIAGPGGFALGSRISPALRNL